MQGEEQSASTRAITAGRGQQGSSLTPPLWGTSTWQTGGLDDTRKRATGLRADQFYSRYANPTVRAFEEAIADLEGAEDALAFSSGHGRRRVGGVRAVLHRRPRRRPAPDVCGDERVPARSVCPDGHRRHVGRRHHARRVRQGRDPGPHDARGRRVARRTRDSTSSTSPTSARSPGRSRSSTRRSPRRSANSRSATASTSSSTRPPRGSAGTTTRRSASSPASAT